MKRFTWISALISILLTGCSGSNITSTWKSSSVLELQTGRILVVGLFRESDKSLQQQMENHLADDLCSLGYDAVSSFEIYGPDAFESMQEKTVINKLKEKAFDAVLTIVLLNKQKQKDYIPNTIIYNLSDKDSYNDFYPYYAAIYTRIYEEGYYANDTYYYWESNLYNMADQKLIYSVQTQSFNTSGKSSLAHGYGKIIIQDMLAQNIIKKLHP